MRPGAAQTIREYLRAKVDCSKEKIYAELVLDNRVICYTLKDFLKRGEIERTVDGYRYMGASNRIPRLTGYGRRCGTCRLSLRESLR